MDIADREKFTEVIFENIRDGIVMLDRNYRILAVNNSVGKWTEKPVSELIDKDCREVFHDNTVDMSPLCGEEDIRNRRSQYHDPKR